MENLTYETYLADPAVRAEIDRAARRMRAAAEYRYLVLPVVRFCGRLVAIRRVQLQLDPRRRASTAC